MNNLLSAEQQKEVEACMQNYDGTICHDKKTCCESILRRLYDEPHKQTFLEIIAICILALNM